jgi:4-hydroxythreonine-4-phosphate dehydrogenase
MQLPRLAFTLGDAAGIGPELLARSWLDPNLHQWCVPLAVGNPTVLRRAVDLVGGGLTVVEIDAPEQSAADPQVLGCLAAGTEEVLDVPPATIDPRTGRAAYDCLVLAAELALAGRIDGLVTAPLNKHALHAAGLPYPGHTEALADLTGADEVAMMLYVAPGAGWGAGAGLGVVHVTLHMALADVPRHITGDAVLAKARLVHDVMGRLLGKDRSPRIGLAALNPHAGEGGLFGDEEQRVLSPVAARARAEGIDLSDPLPADTLFWRAAEGTFDAVVAMYHDQGHIAVKLADFHRAVNITLGLPIVRTSPTYGTAFDIAWQGKARVDGMLEAARVAAVLAAPRAPEVQRSSSPALAAQRQS